MAKKINTTKITKTFMNIITTKWQNGGKIKDNRILCREYNLIVAASFWRMLLAIKCTFGKFTIGKKK